MTAKPFDCCYCGAPAAGNFREVTGWEVVRGAAGGANQIVGRKETGRIACGDCIRQIKDGVTPGSAKLF